MLFRPWLYTLGMVTPSPSLPPAPHSVALFSAFGDVLPFSPSYSVTCEKGIGNMPSVGTKIDFSFCSFCFEVWKANTCFTFWRVICSLGLYWWLLEIQLPQKHSYVFNFSWKRKQFFNHNTVYTEMELILYVCVYIFYREPLMNST